MLPGEDISASLNDLIKEMRAAVKRSEHEKEGAHVDADGILTTTISVLSHLTDSIIIREKTETIKRLYHDVGKWYS